MNPIEFFSLLRDHLAAHDRPIGFLLGAGGSCSITAKGGGGAPLIPATEDLTEHCESDVGALGDEYSAAWDQLMSEVNEAGEPPNVESALSRLRRKIEAMGPNEKPLELDREKLTLMEKAIRTRISKDVSPDPATIPDQIPHDQLARWVKFAHRRVPVEVFTTNYDILLERSLEREGVPVFDGFVGSYQPFFDAGTVEEESRMPEYPWARLWKLHGSINWERHEIGGRARVVRTQPNNSGELILPSHWKYDESRKMPYRALMDRLSRFLDRDQSLIITIGYSFRDEHINDRLLTALEKRPLASVIVACFDPLLEDSNIVKLARDRPNLLIVGPDSCTVAGRYRKWDFDGYGEEGDLTVFQGCIKSDAPAPEGVPPNRYVTLGDFRCFAQFLADMTEGTALRTGR
jgi:hypothetical protein